MILKQHLEIEDLEFDISIRKPLPVDKEGGKELDGWMKVIIGALEEKAGESFEWDGEEE